MTARISASDSAAASARRASNSAAIYLPPNATRRYDNNTYTSVGAAWVFTGSGNTWTEQAKLVGTDYSGTYKPQQGTSVALSADGNTAIVGGPLDNGGVGAAWVFTRSGGTWTQEG